MSTCFTLNTPFNNSAMQITSIQQPMTDGMEGFESCVITDLTTSQRALDNSCGRHYPVLAVTRRDLRTTYGARRKLSKRSDLCKTKKGSKDTELANGISAGDVCENRKTCEDDNTNVRIEDKEDTKMSKTNGEDSVQNQQEKKTETDLFVYDPDKLNMQNVMKMVNIKLEEKEDMSCRDPLKSTIEIRFNSKLGKTTTTTPISKIKSPPKHGATRRQKLHDSSQGFTLMTRSQPPRKFNDSERDLKYPSTVSSYSVTSSPLKNDRVTRQKYRLNILNSQTKSYQTMNKCLSNEDTQRTESTSDGCSHAVHKRVPPHCIPLFLDEVSHPNSCDEPYSTWGEYSPDRTSPRTAATIAFKRGLLQLDECLNDWQYCGKRTSPPNGEVLPSLPKLVGGCRTPNVARLHMKTSKTTRENSLMSDLQDNIPEQLTQSYYVDESEPLTPANTPISWRESDSDGSYSATTSSPIVSDYRTGTPKEKIHIFLPGISDSIG